MKAFLEIEVAVEYGYKPGEPAFTVGHADRCHPGSYHEIALKEVLLGKFDILPHLSRQQISELEGDCLEDADVRRSSLDEANGETRMNHRAEAAL